MGGKNFTSPTVGINQMADLSTPFCINTWIHEYKLFRCLLDKRDVTILKKIEFFAHSSLISVPTLAKPYEKR